MKDKHHYLSVLFSVCSNTKTPAVLTLNGLPILARGGGRDVYEHPNDQTSLLKISRAKPKPKSWTLRREKRMFGNLREWYCEQKEYIAAVNRLNQLPDFLSGFRGMCATDLGPAQVVEKISDADSGQLSRNLQRSLSDFSEEEIRSHLEVFFQKLEEARVTIGDLHFRNLLVKRTAEGKIDRIICIDGLGDRTLIKLRKFSDLAYHQWLRAQREKASNIIAKHFAAHSGVAS